MPGLERADDTVTCIALLWSTLGLLLNVRNLEYSGGGRVCSPRRARQVLCSKVVIIVYNLLYFPAPAPTVLSVG